MEEEKRTPERRHRPTKARRQRPEQDIEYTQPKPFFRKKLMVQLLTVAAVVLAIAVGVSIFFKVDTVLVTGAEQYSALTVAQASGIEAGDSLLFFGRAEAASRIKSQLPYVSTVRFEAKLPGTVNIIVEEKTVCYAIEDTDGNLWRMTSDGLVVEKLTVNATDDTTVTGVQLENPAVGEAAVAAEKAQEGETATQAERLSAAIDMMVQLESYELFELVTDVDVSDLFALKLRCGADYQVDLEGREDMDEKIAIVAAVLLSSDRPSSGVLQLFEEDGQWKVQYNPWD